MEGEIIVATVEMDSVDRISELPELILHNILSFLDMKAACRAGVLSKRWHEAWSTIPVLNFQPHYFKKGWSLCPDNKYSAGLFDTQTVSRIVSFIDKTMDRYAEQKYGIRKLYIGIPAATEIPLDRWVGIAVQNQVQDLEIEIIQGDSPKYRLPEVLFSARSLKVLKYNRVRLPNYGTMKLHSLEHLGLCNSVVDANMLQRIISVCPLIDLGFWGCWPLGDISVPWMKRAVSDNEVTGEDFGCKTRHENVKTCSLRHLSYSNHFQCPWPFKMNVAALKNLTKLEIAGANIKDDIVSELTSELTGLESLTLTTCLLLKCINISSFSLKNFSISECHNLEKATIDAPNLAWFWITADFMLAPSTINVNAELKPALSIINMQDNCDACLTAWVQFPNFGWFVKFKEFLLEKNIFKRIQMYTDWDCEYEADVDEVQLQKIDSRPPHKLREFKLDDTCRCELKQSLISAFLDLLFWSCHPDFLVIPTSFENAAIKMILKVLKDKAHCSEHSLKSIEVKGLNGSNLFSPTCTLEIRLQLSW